MIKRVLLIGGIVIVTSVPYGTGISAQSSLESMIAKVAEEGLGKVEIVEYDRGWFSSDVKLNYAPPGPQFFGQTDAVPLVASIHHGPITWSSHGVGVGLAEAVIEPDFSALDTEKKSVAEGADGQTQVMESTLERLHRILGGNKEGLSLVASIGFGGDVLASLVIDKIESNTLEGDRITFDGGTVSASFNEQGMTGQGNVALGSFKIDKGASVFSSSPLNAVFDYQQESPGLYVGYGKGTVDQIGVESAANAMTFKDVNIETERKIVDGAVEDKTVVRLGTIEAPLPITSANLVQEWKGVDPESFTMFQGGLWGDDSLSPEESQERVKQSVNALLQPGFSYGLSVDLNSQESSAKADLGLSFVGTPDATEPFDFLSAKSQLGIAGIDAILKTIAGEINVAIDEDFIGAIGPFAGMFMQPPYFEKRENQYIAKGVLSDGTLTMNGQPIPLFPSQQAPIQQDGAMLGEPDQGAATSDKAPEDAAIQSEE